MALYVSPMRRSDQQKSPRKQTVSQGTTKCTVEGCTSAVIASPEVPLGEHRGRTFNEVLEREPDYCNLLVTEYMRSGAPGCPMWHFVAYIVNKQRLNG
eukprot:3398090-Amphidinium_carterae.1